MTAHACLVAVALVVPPVPQGARPDVREGPLEGLSADELYDRGAYLEAADVPGHFIHVILGRDPSGVWAVA